MAYHSAGREESARRTRTAILIAARSSFVDHGWAATTIRGVATEAGVSPESVYKNFSGKAGLLKAVYDTMLAGDDDPLTIAERPEVAAVRAATTPDRAASAYGSLVAVLAARTQPLMAVVVQARGSDPALDEFAAGLDAERRAGTAAAVRHWHSCGWVAAGQVEAATDVVWTLNSPAVRSMLRGRGWQDEAYARWIAGCVVALVFGLTP